MEMHFTNPPVRKDPVVLSYLALRKFVGIVAFLLPFAVAVPWYLMHHEIETSISAYYYTAMRTVFTGSLCAIAMFMLGARGYDSKDETFSLLSAICAIGVALFPTSPGFPSCRQIDVSYVHYTFAATLFIILAIFCLFLFTMSAGDKRKTEMKIVRNRIYIACGMVIVISLILLPIFVKLVKWNHGGITFESTSLWAFGFAWMVKGEMFFKDRQDSLARTRTTDGHEFVGDPHPS